MTPRLRFPLLCSLLLLAAATVSAETIHFDPPNPTASRSVDAIITGVWPNACLPKVKSVVITATTITLHFDATTPPGVLCAQFIGPYTRTFHMGIVPPGGYTVILVSDAGTTSTELALAPLIVRDAETIVIVPYAVPISGGRITITNALFVAGTLRIGGITVPAQSGGELNPSADAPPHAAGVVNVSLDTGFGTTTAKAALIYYDPASTDPAIFEPIVFPSSFQGPGSLGSQWTTENFIYASGQSFFRDPLPCTLCGRSPLNLSTRLFNNGNPWGHVLYAIRGTADTVDFSSRIRDTSRQAETAGTEVPVVRERDFRNRLRFLNVPVDPRYRVTLRVWSLDETAQSTVVADTTSTSPQNQTLTVSKIPGTSMSFGSMDVTSLLARGSSRPTDLTVTGASNVLATPSLWGMLSITNNDTQQVTIISPH